MTDPAFSLLVQSLDDTSDKTLIILDENASSAELIQLKNFPSLTAVTNRYDVWQAAMTLGIDCTFNDFDFSIFQQQRFARIGFRIAKEKPVTHHVVNRAMELLAPNGCVLLTGAKNEGIKGYGKNIGKAFNTEAKIEKKGAVYIVTVPAAAGESGRYLDDSDYSLLRPSACYADKTFFSKPGVFGWNKIDQGSLLLAEELAGFFNLFSKPVENVLDLGCGYGFLSVQANELITARFVATDNNAAAVVSCKKNFVFFNIPGDVVADNCAKGITEKFDAVLCHPPFHRGFDTEHKLTELFVATAHGHLKSHGMALFVANQFIPLENLAKNYFASIKVLVETKSFKVVLFGEPF